MTEDITPAAAPDNGVAPAAEPSAVSVRGAPALSPPDWHDAVPADLRRVAEKFPAPSDAVKSYAELERRLGRSVVFPGPDANAAERDAFYNRLGRPATPDGYRITVPDGLPQHLWPKGPDNEIRGDFLRSMHKAGATPEVVQAVADWYFRLAPAAESAKQTALAASHAEAEAGLRREWGADYDLKLNHAGRAAHHFGGRELDDLLKESGLGNNPVWLRTLARIGAEMVEDTILNGAVDDGRSAQERIDRIMAEHFGKPSYGTPAIQSELRQLYERIYGVGPARPDAA